MALEHSILQPEIQDILYGDTPVLHSAWHVNVIANNERFPAMKILSIDIVRDYVNSYGDQIVIECLFGLGTYQHDIIPFKDNLLVEITKTINTDTAFTGSDTESEIEAWVYRAFLPDIKDEVQAATTLKSSDKITANLDDLKIIKLQLLDIALDQIRTVEVGGIYYEEIPGDVIKYTLSSLTSALNLDKENEIRGVDIVDYDNKEKYPQIVIPHGTPPYNVPSLIQDHWGGVYNTDIGCYLQKGLWYVWPLYNTRRFNKERKILTLINIPSTKYPGVERTYKLVGKSVVALSTGEVAHSDATRRMQMNLGSGTRFYHGDGYWGKEEEFKKNTGESKQDNRFIIKRQDNISEYNAIKQSNTKYAPLAENRQSNNSFSQISKLAKRVGSILTLVWENSDPDLTYPGMPVKIYYLKNDEAYEAEGVLLKAHHYIHDNLVGPVTQKHVCNSALGVFTEVPFSF